jgi:hypothetical protein
MLSNHTLHDDPQGLLAGLLARSRAHGKLGVFAFDLDSTLFDNRPRQQVILREFGASKADPRLATHALSCWTSGWDMRSAMVAAGLSGAEADALQAEGRAFWGERFFTSEYAPHDVEIPGAVAFVQALAATGATIVYVTGRYEPMRPGTLVALAQCRFPVPTADGRVTLLMKPDAVENDDAFKERMHAEVRARGELVAAFDNEPSHANGYRRSFPGATVVHLATDHSGRPVTLLPGIVSIPNFGK